VLAVDESKLLLVTTNCGQRVRNITPEKMEALRQELMEYGVKHYDWDVRNITYSQQLGRFCVIDFEYAQILDDPEHQSPMPFPDQVPPKD
ncbi:MAG: hypothetical protein NZL93_03225, partial [Chthoniobacterales bacterium]|nr:hypothetical protein [Chthoniobacterales bacterium]